MFKGNKIRMQIIIPVLSAFFGCLLLFFSGCETDPVDKRYLQSEGYLEFEEKRQREYSAQVDSDESLQKYLHELIKCDKGPEFSLPFHFDNNILKKSGEECRRVSDRYNTPFKVYLLGYSRLKDVYLRWLLLESESVYKDLELITVTHRDSTLIDFQRMGSFKKNLSQKISTDIRVFQKDDLIYISSVRNKSLQYPIEMEDVLQDTFRIDKDGLIDEQDNRPDAH